jgi:hypothetical protein
MAFTTQVLENGPRNYIVHVVGSAAQTSTTLVDLATLDPPANRLRLNKVVYDVGVGGVFTILFGTDPVVNLTEGNGQMLCYNKAGGINDINGPDNANFTFTGTSTYTVTAYFIKKRSDVAPLVGDFITTEGGDTLITESNNGIVLEN